MPTHFKICLHVCGDMFYRSCPHAKCVGWSSYPGSTWVAALARQDQGADPLVCSSMLHGVRRGGHCGFLQGLWPLGAAWSDDVMAQFFAALLQEEGAAAALQACKAATGPAAAAAPEPAKSRSFADFMHLSAKASWLN